MTRDTSQVKDGKVVEVSRTISEQEISCLNFNPLGLGQERNSSNMVAVGMWDKSVHCLRIPSLEVCRHVLWTRLCRESWYRGQHKICKRVVRRSGGLGGWG